ncbi:MAG TPA: EamA family transporter [Candidatus Acidoferrum sp.]|nr:EamA family transporter [Candidatus Acidoferrum sp.]
MNSERHPAAWKTWLAFGIIYFVWGSTYYAIRVGVREVPPFLLAGMRFLIAGAGLYGWTRIRGQRGPSRGEWGSIAVVAFLIFVMDYGLVFWAEQRVASGLTAVMMATIPAFMALAEIFILKTQRLTIRLAAALLVGLGGVGVLVSRSLDLGGAPIDRMGAAGLILGAVSWSIASVLSRKLPMPEAKVMSSGAQMLAGGVFLAVISCALGEYRNFHPGSVSRGAWIALVYLIVAGSIIAFTAYVWLLHHESPTKVGTYAYVNPVVAVVLGYFLGGEELGARTVLGTVFVLVSVLVITTTKAEKSAAMPIASEAK